MNTLKIGTFVNYDAENDGKELMNPMVYAEVIKKNSDGTVNLQPHDCDDFDEIENANPECCTPLDHFAGMTDSSHYYLDGKYNVYGGYYEHYITTKELGNPYSFEGTLDSLEEANDLMCYYDDTILLDKDLEEEWGDALGKPDVVDLSTKTESCKSSMQRKQESIKANENEPNLDPLKTLWNKLTNSVTVDGFGKVFTDASVDFEEFNGTEFDVMLPADSIDALGTSFEALSAILKKYQSRIKRNFHKDADNYAEHIRFFNVSGDLEIILDGFFDDMDESKIPEKLRMAWKHLCDTLLSGLNCTIAESCKSSMQRKQESLKAESRQSVSSIVSQIITGLYDNVPDADYIGDNKIPGKGVAIRYDFKNAKCKADAKRYIESQPYASRVSFGRGHSEYAPELKSDWIIVSKDSLKSEASDDVGHCKYDFVFYDKDGTEVYRVTKVGKSLMDCRINAEKDADKYAPGWYDYKKA